MKTVKCSLFWVTFLVLAVSSINSPQAQPQTREVPSIQKFDGDVSVKSASSDKWETVKQADFRLKNGSTIKTTGGTAEIVCPDGSHLKFDNNTTATLSIAGDGRVQVDTAQGSVLATLGKGSAAEAFHFNNTEIIRAINDKYPLHVRTELKSYDIDTDDEELYRSLNVKKDDPEAGDLIGRLYDRDVVAFFGDPAFEVRIKPGVIVTTDKLLDGKFAGCWQIKIDAVADGAWSDAGETYFALPYSMPSVKCVYTDLKGDIDYADNFILVALQGDYKKGDSFRIILKESPSDSK